MTTALARKKTVPRHRAASKAAPWNLRRAGRLQILEAPHLAKLKWLVHGFSTRAGGASRLDAPSQGEKTQEKILNLGFTEWDSRERVTENREKFFHAIGASKMRVVTLRQIHSDIVHRVDARGNASTGEPSQGDA